MVLLAEHNGAEPVGLQVWLGVGENNVRIGKGSGTWTSNRPWYSGGVGTMQLPRHEWFAHVYSAMVMALAQQGWSEEAGGEDLMFFVGGIDQFSGAGWGAQWHGKAPFGVWANGGRESKTQAGTLGYIKAPARPFPMIEAPPPP